MERQGFERARSIPTRRSASSASGRSKIPAATPTATVKVDAFGAKRWELGTVVRGNRCDIGLVGLKAVSLAEAREAARKYRAMARNDGDPLAEKRRTRKVARFHSEACSTTTPRYIRRCGPDRKSDPWDLTS